MDCWKQIPKIADINADLFLAERQVGIYFDAVYKMDEFLFSVHYPIGAKLILLKLNKQPYPAY